MDYEDTNDNTVNVENVEKIGNVENVENFEKVENFENVENSENVENDTNDTNDTNYQPQQENEGLEHPIDFSEVIQFAARFQMSTFVMSAFTNLVAKGGIISVGIFNLVPSYK